MESNDGRLWFPSPYLNRRDASVPSVSLWRISSSPPALAFLASWRSPFRRGSHAVSEMALALGRFLFDPLRDCRSGLQIDHRPVPPAGGHQFIVAALLDDPAVLHHQDPVRVGDRAEAVGDDEARAAGHQRVQAALDEALAL